MELNKYKTCKFIQQFACWHEKLPAWQRSLDEFYFTLISQWINWQLTLDSDTFQLNASHSQTSNGVQIDELFLFCWYSFHLLFVFYFITNQCLFPSLHTFFLVPCVEKRWEIAKVKWKYRKYGRRKLFDWNFLRNESKKSLSYYFGMTALCINRESSYIF